jgi:hypothetical protein
MIVTQAIAGLQHCSTCSRSISSSFSLHSGAS